MDKFQKAYERLVAVCCLGVLAIILAAGLWPFHAPANQAAWLAGQNGIRLGHHGTLVSAGKFSSGTNANPSGSLELWVEPEIAAKKKTILTFDGSDHPGEPFSVLQDNDALEIRRHNIDGAGTVHTGLCTAGGIFHKGQSVLLAITLSERQTSVYANGAPAKTCAIAGSSTNNLSGAVVVANSDIVSNSWPGKILGLAMYQDKLNADETARDYESWTRNGRPQLAEAKAPAALYLFDEQSGAIAHNQISAATDLRIPAHYLILHPMFLESPWREYRPRWSYWIDVAVNVAGFMPWGFCLAAYLYSVKGIARPAAAIVLLGFVVSFIIEVSQAWLPTRSSGCTDLITNTLGTALGLTLYRLPATQNLLHKIMGYFRLRQERNHLKLGFKSRHWDRDDELAAARPGSKG
ncbi:MAG: VanZ family protein [Candidatus Sulfotelmatobacter sp.]